jgi:hypothetical protein
MFRDKAAQLCCVRVFVRLVANCQQEGQLWKRSYKILDCVECKRAIGSSNEHTTCHLGSTSLRRIGTKIGKVTTKWCRRAEKTWPGMNYALDVPQYLTPGEKRTLSRLIWSRIHLRDGEGDTSCAASSFTFSCIAPQSLGRKQHDVRLTS